ncbi:hypothetical protein AXF41_01825 [Clostridium haemolyticum]|uniref:hypothetical protein n=1 Tax=Clostridium haemolyticum TaxID=84025 RepID=UPI0009C98461|nr:hypothetical protein [Clostridium haemolyticum]OOB75063.1 hypothetical protein AXF41_01825 [Clostridium haemolyticum]
MSNHDGGYMLNSVLESAIEMKTFEAIEKEKINEFVVRLIRIGRGHDCNAGEILEGLEVLGICYCCLEDIGEANLRGGLCKKCRR